MELTKNQLVQALAGVAKVCHRGDQAARDDLSVPILLLLEMLIAISVEPAVASQSRIEQKAREIALIENSLPDIDPRERATVGRRRLGLSKSSYYRNRALAKKMQIL